MLRLLSRAWLCVVLALPAFAFGDHEDKRLGFRVGVPKDWTPLPVNVEERWVVGKYLSPKSYSWTEKGGWTTEHTPDMTMIAFVTEAMKEKIKVKKETDRDGNEFIRVIADSPYKDYQDFLKRRYSGGGWYVDKTEETKVDDTAVTTYEIRVDKLSYDGPKRIVTWVYHMPDVDVAVQFEVLQDAYPKVQTEVLRCLKSFKGVKRNGEALVEASTPGQRFSFLELDKMPPEERAKHRQGMERESHERATKTAPPGWVVKKMGRFLVINHSDERFAKDIVERAEAVWDWLDGAFPFIGVKEYVRAPIIRICKDDAEYNAFFKSSDGWSFNDIEITAYNDNGGSTSWQLENVNRQVLDVWFTDKDRDLYWALPGWLTTGLSKVVASIRLKNGKVDFASDSYTRDETREMMREGRSSPVKEILTMSGRSFWEKWENYYQASSLVMFFVDGTASRSKRTKELLPEYMRALKAVAEDIRKEKLAKKEAGKDAASKKPQTEEEEAKWFREQRDALKDADQRLLQETFQRTFVGWTDRDWADFQDAFQKSIGFRSKK